MNIKRLHMEIFTAASIAAVSVLAATGSLELGVTWGDSGPKPGYFPFYVGLIVIAASIGCAVQAILKARSDEQQETFLEPEQARRLLSFFIPMIVFVVVTIFLGLYVGSALYLFYVAWRQGKYKPQYAMLMGIAFSIALYLVFETAFQVPLHKGPLEDMLGIY
ncbi:tripartite tricarboxylate transporter TctB family protein [Rhizobium ruizarguesonis]|uniref:tripartite tricarboxylate transporter TctB family protein n=1 Tax=Rhizobium ruizarguesonis TaxID=2081791 RepID=UPI001031EF55|nr:tripartite tricarboxylate transporter TctB family protein [Rhizobium ruizarguesonis]TBY58634.1 tripartite tricarboxylate transporter TctB family protein [Rhizobium leguminosarum bv. viciae]TAT72615.1 tripartite tricarboxylate transporter TctB family protein [Rhizobium ruizarguesonis]TAT93315.1 tripartite tricarboxylate transporter TctB family protein [Rhizobium ruizarguesonis]TAZ25699.1 tripartite tricarboxylate transporter TctB family protein [Rhizobium ruizarguesonis]TBD10038.1 tripartite